MAVEVRTPEEYMGDVMGDINARRGSIQSMTDSTGVKVIDAKVPLSEMFGYIGDLRSKTQGRAMFTMQMDSYAEVQMCIRDSSWSALAMSSTRYSCATCCAGAPA